MKNIKEDDGISTMSQRVISTEQGQAKAKALGAIAYIETSALSGDKVPEAFREIGKKLLKDRKK